MRFARNVNIANKFWKKRPEKNRKLVPIIKSLKGLDSIQIKLYGNYQN